MSRYRVKVSPRKEGDWSEDEALLALQSSPKPPGSALGGAAKPPRGTRAKDPAPKGRDR